jgi:hypothetical protein
MLERLTYLSRAIDTYEYAVAVRFVLREHTNASRRTSAQMSVNCDR